jgi:NADH dehydrogenase FAD-containing subunit
MYQDLLPFVKLTLVEAGPALLGPFDSALQDYAHGLFKKRDIDIRLGTAVIGVEDFVGEGFRFPGRRAILSDGSTLEFGTMVWSAGLAPRAFTESLDSVLERHPRNKRILVDEFLRVKGYEGSIWAIGDASVNESGVPIPQLAQAASDQWLSWARIVGSMTVLRSARRETEQISPAASFQRLLGSWLCYYGDLLTGDGKRALLTRFSFQCTGSSRMSLVETFRVTSRQRSLQGAFIK